MLAPGLELVGLHCHSGSQIYEPESPADAAAVLIAFAAEMRDRHSFTLRELSPGGGWGVQVGAFASEAQARTAASAARSGGRAVSRGGGAAARAHGLPRLAKVARALNVTGPFNMQLLAKDGDVRIIETNRAFQGSNGIEGHGGAIDVGGAIVSGGQLFVLSGYGMFGQMPGNLLLVYGLPSRP
jgi:hypothetical protein